MNDSQPTKNESQTFGADAGDRPQEQRSPEPATSASPSPLTSWMPPGSWQAELFPKIGYAVFVIAAVFVGRLCGVPAPKTAFGFMRPALVGAIVLASPLVVLGALIWLFDRIYAPDADVQAPPLPGRWWLLLNGRPTGPFTEAALVDALERGDFPVGSLVAPAGSQEWRLPAEWPEWPGNSSAPASEPSPSSPANS